MAVTLRDVGEFAIVDRLLTAFPRSAGLGDDCFHLQVQGSLLAVTADPGPVPLTRLLGSDWEDMYVSGWYAALASASDLASVGAKPLLMTNCVLAPGGMALADLDRYFAGFREAIEAFGFLHAGGDVSSADVFRSVCTAVGTVPKGRPLGRRGCRPGDHLACVGTCGSFATAFLKALRVRRTEISKDVERALIRPMPRLEEVRSIRSVATLSAASDASDGLLAAIWNIAQASQCAFSLILDEAMLSEELREEAAALALDPWTLFAFWGDWQVVVSFPPSEEPAVADLSRSTGIPVVPLGRATTGKPRIEASIAGRHFSVRPFGNEHFTQTSYLLADLEDVISMMRQPVFEAIQ